MYVVSMIGQKGGSGKTTLAINLAVAAAKKGLSSVIVDLDPQANAANWRDRRELPNPEVISAPPARLGPILKAAEEAGAEYVCIDNPGKADSGAIAAAGAANLILVPVGLQMFHLETLAGVYRLLQAAVPNPAAWLVLNAVHPSATVQLESMRRLLESSNPMPVCPIHLTRLEAYATSADKGQSPLESAPGSRAAVEVANLYKWTIKQLEKTTNGGN